MLHMLNVFEGGEGFEMGSRGWEGGVAWWEIIDTKPLVGYFDSRYGFVYLQLVTSINRQVQTITLYNCL